VVKTYCNHLKFIKQPIKENIAKNISGKIMVALWLDKRYYITWDKVIDITTTLQIAGVNCSLACITVYYVAEGEKRAALWSHQEFRLYHAVYLLSSWVTVRKLVPISQICPQTSLCIVFGQSHFWPWFFVVVVGAV
jgi:hypothetical protein